MTRIRELDTRQNIPFGTSSISANGCNIEPSVNYNPPTMHPSTNSTGIYRVMVDAKTPDFFKLKKSGSPLPTNVLSVDELELGAPQDVDLHVSYWRTQNTCLPSRRSYTVWKGCYLGLPPPQSVVHVPYTGADLRNAMLLEAITAVKQEFMDMSTFLAEVHKTVSMVMSFRRRCLQRVSRIRKDWEAAKRREKYQRTRKYNKGVGIAKEYINNKGVLKSWEEFLTSMWMEARYGWRPMLFDVQDIERSRSQWNQTLRTAMSRTRTVTAGSKVGSWTNIGSLLGVQYRDVTTTTVTFRGGGLFESKMSAPFRFDPLVTMNEVLPYLFVANWFVNVGSNILAFSPLSPGAVVLDSWGSKTTETLVVREYRTTIVENDQRRDLFISGLPRTTFSKRTSIERAPMEAHFELNLLLKLDLLKGVDLLILLKQLRRR